MQFKATALRFCVSQNLKGIHYEEVFQVPSEVTCINATCAEFCPFPNCLLSPPPPATTLPWDPLPNTLLELKSLSQGQLLGESNCKSFLFYYAKMI